MSELLSHLMSIGTRGPLPGLVWAISVDASGTAREHPAGMPLGSIGEGWLWLHFNLTDPHASRLLDELPGVPRQAAMLIRTREEIPQIHCDGTVTYGILSDLQRDLGATNEELGPLHFVMAGRILITTRRTPLSAPGAIRQLIVDGRRMLAVEDLLSNIIEHVVDGVDLYVERISREVDGLEDRIISGSIGDARGRLAKYRRTMVRLRRHVSELRMMFLRLQRDSRRTPVPEWLLAQTSEVLQGSEELDRDILSLGARTRLLQDEVVTLLTEETNKHLRALSVLTILFMPPTFIAGLFGMNLKGMPFSPHDLGFWSATLIAVVSSAAVFWALKRLGIFVR